MRSFIIVVALLIAVSLGYLGYAHLSGGAVTTFGLPLGGEKAAVRALTLAFFEHVKFKNTSALDSFVAKGTSKESITNYLMKTLGAHQEQIDLQSVTIDEIELDSSGMRARCKVHLLGFDLRQKQAIDHMKILFLYKNNDGNWLLDVDNLLSS